MPSLSATLGSVPSAANSMSNISEAAGSSAQAAADQLAADASKVTENILICRKMFIKKNWACLVTGGPNSRSSFNF